MVKLHKTGRLAHVKAIFRRKKVQFYGLQAVRFLPQNHHSYLPCFVRCPQFRDTSAPLSVLTNSVPCFCDRLSVPRFSAFVLEDE